MKKLLLILLSLAASNQLYAISQNEVYFGTTCTALGAGLITHAISGSVIADVVVGGGSGALAYYILSQFTPEGRFERAKAHIERIERNPFAMREFESEQELLGAVQEVYVLYDLYLMAAYGDIAAFIESGYEAISLLDAARSEASADLNLVQRCDQLASRATQALGLMKEVVRCIRSNDEYLTQCKIYKQEQAAKAQLAVQHQIAHAQSQMAQAQIHQAYYR